MKLPSDLKEARFVRRLNRFAALVDLDGTETLVHVANSGRMRELLVPGYRVLLKTVSGRQRKTVHDLALVDLGHTLCSADARLPPFLVQEALQREKLAQFQGYDAIQLEVVYQDSRYDLRLDGPKGFCYVETKSVTLVEDGVGLFPNAPTERGRKHVAGLAEARREGHRAAVIFVVQREDAEAFAPNDAADPAFGKALRRAVADGVEVYAYRCQVSLAEINLGPNLAVRL